ncbi:MAG TPA: hypothetical protein VLB44_23140, partial [Kofleriaceae bacterium]|nr:hypothetical protein [Kofleriaceae bacterium]
MRGWLGALCLLTGCDQLFKLTHVAAPPDATTDDTTARPDGPSCISKTAHDEDGDKLHDDCDPCPTVTSTFTSLDEDGDGLTTECDPNLSTSVNGDTILLASMFASTTELATDYVPSGATNPSVSGDRLLLPPNTQVATMRSMLPTQMVATFAGLNGAASGDTFQLGANGGNCNIAASGCAGEPGQICVSLGAPVTYAIPISTIKTVTVSQSSGFLHCKITTGVASMTFDTAGQITTSVAFARTT